MTEEAGIDFHIWGPCNSWQGCCTVLRERLRSGSHIPASAGQDIPLHGIHILHVLRNVGRTGRSATGQVSGGAVMAARGSKGTRPFGAKGSGDGARHPRETPRRARPC